MNTTTKALLPGSWRIMLSFFAIQLQGESDLSQLEFPMTSRQFGHTFQSIRSECSHAYESQLSSFNKTHHFNDHLHKLQVKITSSTWNLVTLGPWNLWSLEACIKFLPGTSEPWDHENYLAISGFSLYDSLKKQRKNMKTWDQCNYLVIKRVFVISAPQTTGENCKQY